LFSTPKFYYKKKKKKNKNSSVICCTLQEEYSLLIRIMIPLYFYPLFFLFDPLYCVDLGLVLIISFLCLYIGISRCWGNIFSLG